MILAVILPRHLLSKHERLLRSCQSWKQATLSSSQHIFVNLQPKLHARNLTDIVMDIFSSLNVTHSARNETRIKNTAVENYPHHINSVIANRLNKISAPQDTPPATRKVSYASVLSSTSTSTLPNAYYGKRASVKKTINSG